VEAPHAPGRDVELERIGAPDHPPVSVRGLEDRDDPAVERPAPAEAIGRVLAEAGLDDLSRTGAPVQLDGDLASMLSGAAHGALEPQHRGATGREPAPLDAQRLARRDPRRGHALDLEQLRLALVLTPQRGQHERGHGDEGGQAHRTRREPRIRAAQGQKNGVFMGTYAIFGDPAEIDTRGAGCYPHAETEAR